ncbi:MAG: histidinol-phosphate transaminase [Thermoanaerobacteraceae bacterium]|nr:histidinol-phosphate transaminase [Thermoanaerobacteraceae bacterium]
MKRQLPAAGRTADLHPFPMELPDLPVEELRVRLGRERVYKLSFNENPYGPSPAVARALQEAAATFHLYPDAYGRALCAQMAAFYGLSPEQFLLGNGADEVINLVAMAFLDPGDRVLIPSPTFGAYGAAARLAGAVPVTVPLKDYRIDLDLVAAAVTAGTKMIFLCNPNNPTGTAFPAAALASFLNRLPEGVLVVVDEAYNEYTDDPASYTALSLLDTHPHLLVIRTFSKIYGLAAARVGYLMGSAELIRQVHRVRPPFNVGAPGQVAALAAFGDRAYVDRMREQNSRQRRWLTEKLTALGWRVVPGQANFLLVDTGRDGREAFTRLAEQGVIVRPCHGFQLPTCLRITIGRPEENAALVQALEGENTRGSG